ncbi:hypothetical protein AAG906_029090 [Vitis piasezkii]
MNHRRPRPLQRIKPSSDDDEEDPPPKKKNNSPPQCVNTGGEPSNEQTISIATSGGAAEMPKIVKKAKKVEWAMIECVHEWKRLRETGHTRLGWSTEKGDLQTPVGYDANGFGYRDIDGTKVHKTMEENVEGKGYLIC